MNSAEPVAVVTALLLISIVVGFVVYVAIAPYVSVWVASLIDVVLMFIFFIIAVAKIVYLLQG
jgi:hypothetical protein